MNAKCNENGKRVQRRIDKKKKNKKVEKKRVEFTLRVSE
jgi:hypothetical protein